MTRAIATAALGFALCLAAATVDSPSLYVPGVALMLLAVGAVAWVELAAHVARVEREVGPLTVLEEEPYLLRVELGASPRAGLMLFRAAKALAALEGRDHALPDDVQALAPSVLPHRLLLAPDTVGDERAGVVRDALGRVPAL